MVYKFWGNRVLQLTYILIFSVFTLSTFAAHAQGNPEIYGPRHQNDQCDIVAPQKIIAPTPLPSIGKLSKTLATELPRYSVTLNTPALIDLLATAEISDAAYDELYEKHREDFGQEHIDAYTFDTMTNDDLLDAETTIFLKETASFKPVPANRDSLAKIATKEALAMVEQHYADIMRNKPKGTSQAIDETELLTLSQRALQKSAEAAFRKFVQEKFHKYSFDGIGYSTLRASYMNAYMSVVERALGNVGRKVAEGITPHDFKSIKFNSELLRNLDKDVATAIIDTGLDLAQNSQYAFLRNLEVQYKIREGQKPEYSATTVQPIFSTHNRMHNIFAQGTISAEDQRRNFSAGIGYRYMPKEENYVVGTNAFLDYQRPYNHMRASFGLDVHTSLLSASTNFYKGLNNWKKARVGFEEKPLDGLDFEIAGRMPFLPALEVSARGYAWKTEEQLEDIEGVDLRVAYSPIPAVTIEGGFTDEKNQKGNFDIALRYNYIFGAPPEYLYNWDEQFRQKSASEYIFNKARRENTIRLEERKDPESVTPFLLSTAPATGSIGLSIGTDLVLTFDKSVLAGGGNITFTDTVDASDNFTIPVTDPRVTIVNNVVTVDLSAQLLDFNTSYDITMASGTFTDTDARDFPGLNTGELTFQTVVDPTATFGAPDQSLAPGATAVATISANNVASFQTTINIGAGPDGIIFECGGTGQGIGAWFDAGNLVYGAGNGTVTTTTANTIFGTFPIASIPQGLHHFTFVAKPTAAAEIGVYMDGIRIIDQSIAGTMESGRWSGGNDCGYGLQGGGSIRDGGNTNNLSNATLTNNFGFYAGDQPLDF